MPVVPRAVVIDLEQGAVRPWLKFLGVLITLSSLSHLLCRLGAGSEITRPHRGAQAR
jgi:hypothetical protein